MAAVLDALIMAGIVLSLWLVGAAAGAGDGGFVAAVLIVISFLVLFGYDVAFETLASGRTPGKRAAGLRVVRLGGEPPGFLTAAVRNLLRLVDILPGFYAVGAVSILASGRNQRLGDHAAGTLVVRERRVPAGARSSGTAESRGAADRLAAWDVSSITAYELATVRRFLERRHDLQPAARARLAAELAERLRPKVLGAPPDSAPEDFLEDLATAKASRA